MRNHFLAATLCAAIVLTGCTSPNQKESPTTTSKPAATSPTSETLTIYSGRNEKLVKPLLEQIETATGIKVNVRYAGTAELAAQILEEGTQSPADLFFSQDAGAMAELGQAKALAPIDKATLDHVPTAYKDPAGNWVATSGRIRVLAVNETVAPAAAKYTKIDQILDPENAAKIAYAPTNASFQAFVTALRIAKGEAGAKEFLTKFKALNPKAYEKNTAVLEAVDKGEAGIGLINHYYWHKLVAEKGTDQVKAKLVYLDPADPGALLNVASVGILASSKKAESAQKVVAFLLSKPAQEYFANTTAEYPVIDGIKSTKFQLKEIDVTKPHGVDLNQLDSLKQTQALLREVGLI